MIFSGQYLQGESLVQSSSSIITHVNEHDPKWRHAFSLRCCQAALTGCTLSLSPVYVSRRGRSGKRNDFYGRQFMLFASATQKPAKSSS